MKPVSWTVSIDFPSVIIIGSLWFISSEESRVNPETLSSLVMIDFNIMSLKQLHTGQLEILAPVRVAGGYARNVVDDVELFLPEVGGAESGLIDERGDGVEEYRV
ncbi:hypothetical protein EB796_000336 [Bugula neritina]|uniref:Uncharacterized protein n=1 Tax=Bugula neritina TaxID=10212 RepID=A0A7J7KT69_BUGNE|nr:hypothetical protein EB796_000336 [Bugula neritina]